MKSILLIGLLALFVIVGGLVSLFAWFVSVTLEKDQMRQTPFPNKVRAEKDSK